MKYTLHENLEDRNGVISNLHGFVNRHLDTGFKSKWSGFWVPPFKYLDYYALKINGVWLNPNSLDAVEYGDQIDFHHSTDTLEIKETVKTPQSFAGFKVELQIENKADTPKAVHINSEVGVDIRSKSQDIGPDTYDEERTDNGLKISKGDRYLEVSSQEDLKFTGESYLKDHYPEGNHQKCLIPGTIVYKLEIPENEQKTVEINFRTDRDTTGSLDQINQDFMHETLGRAFKDSIDSMENLIYDKNGLGIIAGHPWFQSYWARDTFWTVLGLIDAGHFEASKEILENFAGNMHGKINLAEDIDEAPRARNDTHPLFIIAADKLRRHFEISESVSEAMEESMKQLEMDGNIVEHAGEGTWMDTLERSPAIDIQSLWLEAANIMEDKREIKLEKGLKQFENDDYVLDELSDDSAKTINPTIPLMFGHFDEEAGKKYLSKINAEFSSRYGARTRSMADPGYESDGYHTGSVWGLTTGWAAAANLKYGKEKQGINFLEKLASQIDDNQLGGLPEVVDAESGELLGCPEQAWSAGMMTYVVDSYLLGVKVEENRIVIDPVEGLNCKLREKVIGDEKIRFKVDEGTPELLNDPDTEVKLC